MASLGGWAYGWIGYQEQPQQFLLASDFVLSMDVTVTRDRYKTQLETHTCLQLKAIHAALHVLNT